MARTKQDSSSGNGGSSAPKSSSATAPKAVTGAIDAEPVVPDNVLKELGTKRGTCIVLNKPLPNLLAEQICRQQNVFLR